MVKIVSNGRELTLQGHANYSGSGSDIICAAVSAIALTLRDSAETFGVLESSKTLPGDMRITLKHDYRTEILVKAAEIGLERLAANYPDFVSFDRALMSLKAKEVEH
jgi:uncharacterized protein YsxB (DUF464 family)